MKSITSSHAAAPHPRPLPVRRGEDQGEGSPVVLEVTGLCVNRGDYRAVRDVSFTVRRGEFVALMGRSGAGKTTIMHCLAGLLAPSSGTVHWTDQCRDACCAHLAADRPAPVHAVMFQHYRLVPQLSALNNVLCGRLQKYPWWQTVRGFPAAEKKEAMAWLDRVGLAERARLPAGRLSGGEQQRVGVARALIQNPTLLLADEPVASLDAETANEVMGLLRERNQQRGLTVFCVLHDLEMAERFASRVLLLEQGRLVYDGPASNLVETVQEKLQWQTLL